MPLAPADFPTTGPRVLIDADACPVKEEVQKVCFRLKVPMYFAAATYLRLPDHPLIAFEAAGAGFDAADDLIAERSGPGAVVVTQDILLADRCLKAGASAVLSPKGKPWTEASIGGAVATRAIMEDLRAGAGAMADAAGVKGQAPFSKGDRASFLQALDLAVGRAKRG